MSPCFLKLLTFAILLGFVCTSDELKNTPSRQPKILTFNADSEDVEVGLDFSIPFLKIPFKKTINAVAQFGFPGISIPHINLNPTALMLGGLLIISTSILAPLLNQATGWHHFDRSSRSADNETDATFFITEKLLENSRGCPERIACWSSQKNENPEVMKTLKQIIRNNLLSSIVNTTALEIATIKGQRGQNCELYTPCPIDEKNLPKIINSLTILTTSK